MFVGMRMYVFMFVCMYVFMDVDVSMCWSVHVFRKRGRGCSAGVNLACPADGGRCWRAGSGPETERRPPLLLPLQLPPSQSLQAWGREPLIS